MMLRKKRCLKVRFFEIQNFLNSTKFIFYLKYKALNLNLNDFYQISLKSTKKEPSREIVMAIYESIKTVLARYLLKII